MSISVNKKTLDAALSQADAKRELRFFLNEIIDEEIAKDEMNTQLIDECVQALLDLESGQNVYETLASYEQLLQYCVSNAFKAKIYLKRTALVAALVAIAASVTLSLSPALAQQAKDVISSIMQNLGIAADSTNTGKSEIVSIYAVPDESETFTVQSEEEISFNNIKIFSIDKYNCEKSIPLSECAINKERLDTGKIMVTFSYEGCACSIIYTLEVSE